MFEKSLYDLIRGLRNHKGTEKEYIQNCLKECRSEIRGQDMDLKATALLKLIYLEMVGHDMSWASFHVLEVMSSAKYHQKRVGYLGAVQSFRPDTEVLMLATNLLKKDLSSPHTTTISLPTTALPHVITPSLALSVLPDILPRLGHTNPSIRKKTIVTLYRLALVYPETLRAAWPKIKERLMNKGEDSSVTSAIVNVICELGWRRPHDFLPLAPRLFELLVEGGNNWMAIKLIKLFATLTPLEPRLVRKLLPPLTEMIRTTPAMSLLYECINGIIQGGILGSADDVSGREEIATLCVNKLRSMIMVDGDPNLKYVALLAFNKIVVTHPFLVSQQEDVILACIDSPDITIRIKALDLVQGMVSSDNLVLVVSKLMKQLKGSSAGNNAPPGRDGDLSPEDDGTGISGPGTTTTTTTKTDDDVSPLPEDYRIDIIGRVLKMCANDNYANVTDFNWYIDVLISLVRMAPVPRAAKTEPLSRMAAGDVSGKIGVELRNVGVKVKAMRGAVVRAAGSILDQFSSETAPGHTITATALKSAAWLVGEYGAHLAYPQDTLGTLLSLVPRTSPAEIVATSLQAIAKLFAMIAGDESQPWTAERKSQISLLMARVIFVIEPLTLNPNLEVQERAVEFNELLKLSAEAVAGQPASTADIDSSSERESPSPGPPLLLTQALPSLFDGGGWELNSVAPGAQRNVPLPEGLDLDEPIHPNLGSLLAEASLASLETGESDEFDAYYNQKPVPTGISSSSSTFASEPAIERLGGDVREEVASSYQQADEESYLDSEVAARRKTERLERNRDDPFYIQPADSIARTDSTPIHKILQSTNGQDLDIDNIPIMKLDLDNLGSAVPAKTMPPHHAPPTAFKERERVVIAVDETLGGGDGGGGNGAATVRNNEAEYSSDSVAKPKKSKKPKQSLLGVDSSNIGSLSLEGSPAATTAAGFDFERQKREEAEMAKAMREVERLRLEMQRAKERIEVAQGVDVEAVVIKKKKNKNKNQENGKGKETEKVVMKQKKSTKLKGRDSGPYDAVADVDANVDANADADAGADVGADTGAGADMGADEDTKPRKKKKKKREKEMGMDKAMAQTEAVAFGAAGSGASESTEVDKDKVTTKKKRPKKKMAEIQEWT